MSTPNDGGPAFPSDYIPGTATTPGMSLRDYFAASGLSCILLNQQLAWKAHEIARGAYDLADAMLKAREAKP